MLDFCTVSKAEIQSCRRSCERDCARNPRQAVLHVENPCGFGYFTGFLLSQERRMLDFCTVSKAEIQSCRRSCESRNPVKQMSFAKPNHFQFPPSIFNYQLSINRRPFLIEN